MSTDLDQLDFTLEPETHQYFRENGSVLPAVTTALRPLSNFDAVPEHLLREATERGLFVHEATAFHDKGTLVESSVLPEYRVYVEAWKLWRQKTGAVPVKVSGEWMIERPLIHPIYLYGTTPDGLYFIRPDLVVVEKKVTSRHSDVTGLQTSAQAEAIRELISKRPVIIETAEGEIISSRVIRRRLAVRLCKNGKPDVVEHRDRSDFPSFLNFLGAHNWRTQHAKGI